MDVFAIFGLVIVFYLFLLCYLVLNYVFRSLSYYTVAKRRGIPTPGLAWVPLAWVWTQGGICDQYDSTHGITRKWRKVMLVLLIIAAVGIVFGYVVLFAQSMRLAALSYRYWDGRPDFSDISIAGFVIGVVIFFIGMLAATALSVCQFICHYKFFESCRPKDALKYLLLSILVPLGLPICLMCCRNYDLGMPQPQPPYYPQHPAPQMYPYPQQPPFDPYQ